MASFRRAITNRGAFRSRRRFKRKARTFHRRRFTKLPPNVISNSVVRRLKYCQEVSLNPTVGAVASADFAANGLYDPYLSGVGHQPMGFDQLMTFFRLRS